MVSRHDFAPFGEEIPANQVGRDAHFGPYNDTVNQQFTGKERDSESGLDYFGARYYGSALGRFTSPDQPFIDQNVFDPQSWNLYSYVRNNPLRFVDRAGTQAQAFDLEVWVATHEPQLASAAKALMAARDLHSFAQAIKQVVWGSESPSDKLWDAIQSNNVGVAMEGIIGKTIENRFPGDVVGVNVPVPDPTNPALTLTELDVQLKYAVVEVKTGKDAVNQKQLAAQQRLGVPVLVYAPQATQNQAKAIEATGANVFRNLDLLMKAIDDIRQDPGRPTIRQRPK